jgi:acylphosphatase
VEALLEGDAEAITRVERAIRSGPRGARVEQVDVDDQEVGGYRSFTIER